MGRQERRKSRGERGVGIGEIRKGGRGKGGEGRRMKSVMSTSPSVIQQKEEGTGEKFGTNREATRGETETGG